MSFLRKAWRRPPNVTLFHQSCIQTKDDQSFIVDKDDKCLKVYIYQLYRYILAPFFDVLRRHVSSVSSVCMSLKRVCGQGSSGAGGRRGLIHWELMALYSSSLRPHTLEQAAAVHSAVSHTRCFCCCRRPPRRCSHTRSSLLCIKQSVIPVSSFSAHSSAN